MPRVYHVEAQWDPEAKVWVSRSDIPGLVIETATLAEFETLMRELALELLQDHELYESSVSVEWSSKGVFKLAAA